MKIDWKEAIECDSDISIIYHKHGKWSLYGGFIAEPSRQYKQTHSRKEIAAKRQEFINEVVEEVMGEENVRRDKVKVVQFMYAVCKEVV